MKHFLFILILIPIFSFSQVPVSVKAIPQANTSISRDLASQLKKELAAEPEFSIVSPGSAMALELEILSVSYENTPMAVYTVSWYVNWTANPYFIREYLVSDVGYVGSQKVAVSAARLKQRTLKLLGLYREALMRMVQFEKGK